MNNSLSGKINSILKFVYSDNNSLSVIFHDNDLLMGIVGEFNKNLKELEIIRNNRRRMVQITDYEKQRFGSHKNIFRTIAFCGLGVLISVYLVNAGWGTIGKAGIVASIAMGCIFTMSSIYYNWWRSGMNWNRFNFWSWI